MPVPISTADATYAAGGWARWQPPTMADLIRKPWSWDRWAWWNEPVDTALVDVARTNRLPVVDVPISAHAGQPPWQGVTSGFPYQIIASRGPTTKVWDEGRPMQWWPPKAPIVDVPLPAVVRRECDPGGTGWDMHWIGWDPTEAVLWECFVLRPNMNPLYGLFGAQWAASYSSAYVPGVARFDETKAWDAPGQPRGVNAIGHPYLPLLARWDEIRTGRVEHALFGALPLYDSSFVFPARASDGRQPGHPIRGGERLRLRPSAVERFPAGSVARVIAECLARHGWVCGDTSGNGSIALAMDRRFHDGADGLVGLRDAPLGFRLTDCEVVITT